MGDRTTAINFYNAALKALEDKSYKDWATHAFGLFNSACMSDPTFGKLWYQNGNNNGDLNRFQSAVACYRRALRGDLEIEERIHALSNISWRLHQLGELEECITFAKEAVDIGPKHAYGWINLSVGYGAIGRQEDCLACAWKSYEISPDDMTVQFNLAFALLFSGHYAEGFKFFESRFPTRLKHYLTYPYPKWLGEPDKTVFLVADQGLGDTLSFARFVPEAAKRAKYIHAMVQPPLLRPLTEAFVHLRNVNVIPVSQGYPQADVWTTFVSLPFALQLTDEQIKSAPHPRLPVYDISTHWKIPDCKMHIGIQWGGAALNDIDRWRTIPFQYFLALYKVPGVQLYSLQMDDHKGAMHNHACEALVRDLSVWVSDITDTCSILKHLDLVICCESALAHIAGAMDKEVWMLYANHAHDYRIGHDGKNVLWYKHHRIFKQERDRDWERVFDDVVKALRERIDGLERVDDKIGKSKVSRREKQAVG